MRLAKRFGILGVALTWLLLTQQGAHAQNRAPLLLDGTTTLYERVLAKKVGDLHASPDGAVSGSITPFQPFYVYGRQGTDWLEVGRGLLTGPEGWMKADNTVPWRQNIVVSFSNPAARQRQIMFDTKENLLKIIEHEAAIGMARKLRTKAQQGEDAENVVTIEPENAVPIDENFYLLPILDWQQYEHQITYNDNMRILKLASLPLREEEEQEVEETPEAAGLVFVIDTTTSMEPYIEATRAAVQEIVAKIQGSAAGEYVRFGAIGYRDNVQAALDADPSRDIEYLTKLFLPLTADQTPEIVSSSLDQILESQASTVGFNEDAVAGIIRALKMPGWNNAGIDGREIRARYIVVITDAGPKSPRDPNAAFPYVPSAVRQLAEDSRIQLGAVHIKTPDSAPNHGPAGGLFREMTEVGSGQSVYYPVDLTRGGGVEAFRPAVDEIVNFVVGEYELTARDLRDTQQDRDLTALEEASLAMRLAWLGRQQNAQAPDVIEAWTLDYSLEEPSLTALDVRLLVTKNELATLRDVLQEIVTAGEASRDGQQGEFFNLLRNAFAIMSQDSGRLVNTRFETLDEAVGEFLSELPYQSQLLGITPDQWASMGSLRTAILDRVVSSLAKFEFYHDSPQYWTSLYEGQPDGETVFAMPLSELP